MDKQYVITRLPDGISLNAGHRQVLRENGSNKVAYFTYNKALEMCIRYNIDADGILSADQYHAEFDNGFTWDKEEE